MGQKCSKSTPNSNKNLYILTTFFNPAQYVRRIQLHKEFIERLKPFKSSVRVITVECAFENQPFQVTNENNEPYEIQVRSNTRLWIKEGLMNIAIERLKKNKRFMEECEYIAWVDDDIEFSDLYFLQKLRQALERFSVVQMFKQAHFLDANGSLLETFYSFGYYYAEKNLKLVGNEYGHPGFAWATKKSHLLSLGEFFDKGILGNGDKHMSYALIGRHEEGFLKGFTMSPGYIESLHQWQQKADFVFKKNLGYVDMEIRHHWHGSKDDRQYIYRWKLLMDYQYDPFKDLVKEANGLYSLGDTQKELKDKILEFFKGRNEDVEENNEVVQGNVANEPRINKGIHHYLQGVGGYIEQNTHKFRENNFKTKSFYLI